MIMEQQLACLLCLMGPTSAVCHCRHTPSCCLLWAHPAAPVNPATVPMRVGEYSMRVQEVQLVLYPGSSMLQPAPEVRGCQHRSAAQQALPIMSECARQLAAAHVPRLS
jgi:hypothetical protein